MCDFLMSDLGEVGFLYTSIIKSCKKRCHKTMSGTYPDFSEPLPGFILRGWGLLHPLQFLL
jgi:hypothetical protein